LLFFKLRADNLLLFTHSLLENIFVVHFHVSHLDIQQARRQAVRWVRQAKMVRVVEYLIITVSPQERLSPPTVEHSL